MELAGLVLGAFPLAIKGIRQIRDLSSYGRNATKLLRGLETGLEGELQIFKGTCEILLDGILPASRVRTMVHDPTGPQSSQWGDGEVNRKVHLRLDASYDAVTKGMEELKGLVIEFKERMGIREDDQVFAHIFHLFKRHNTDRGV